MKLTVLLTTLSLIPGTALADRVQEGAEIFADACASCHGVHAKGDGPMSQVLTIQPADLTQISAMNEGIFPTARVIRIVDGTTLLTAHGSPMPLFGMLFRGPSETFSDGYGNEFFASRAIGNVVAWIETIQVKE